LRARFVDHFAPYVRDVVFAGADHDDIAALVFPEIEACRKLAGLGPEAPAAAIVAAPAVRAKFFELLTSHAAASAGSSTRVERAIVMEEPPSMDKGEMTDKGSINQRAVLKNRDALVDELYSLPLSSRVIAAEGTR
jgi:feruloyl-CoA synthase